MTVAFLEQPLTNATTVIGQMFWSPQSFLNAYPIAWRGAKAIGTDTHVKAEPMLTSGPVAPLSADMCEYLAYEAARRGVDATMVWAEEVQSRKLFDEEPFTVVELEALVKTSTPDPRLLEGDEECPF